MATFLNSFTPQQVSIIIYYYYYRWTAVYVGNMFQDLPQLCETADNIEHYI